MLIIRAGIHKMHVRIATGKTFITLSLMAVFTVCIGLFDKQLVFEILKKLTIVVPS